jgi:hypothetical protein
MTFEDESNACPNKHDIEFDPWYVFGWCRPSGAWVLLIPYPGLPAWANSSRASGAASLKARSTLALEIVESDKGLKARSTAHPGM